MSTDAGGPPHHYQAQDIWRLPEVQELHVRRRVFDPPRRVTTAGVDRQVREAIEVEIVVSEPFAVRALGPVLWVGAEALTVAEGNGKNVYRFLAFNPEALVPGAAIALAWNSPGTARKETKFRYAAPGK